MKPNNTVSMVDKDCNDPNLHNDPVFSYMSSQVSDYNL